MRLLCLPFFYLALPFLAISQTLNPAFVSERLLHRVLVAPDDYQQISILLEDQLDVRAMELEFRARNARQAERVAQLVPALKNKATTTQGPILELLRGSEQVKPASIRSFWVANIIFAEVHPAMLAQLSEHPDVVYLDWNAPLELEEHVDHLSIAPPVVPDGKEPGLTAIKAPALWAMGYTGYGTVCFTNDTGVDPAHQAIFAQYNGHDQTDQGSWFEYQGNNNGPYDCDDHGTHVTGTVLGLNRYTNDTIGVAFNAQWLGAAILCGIGTADNVAAFEWALDPDGNPATTEDMPDVINNSWRDSGLDNECNNVYEAIFNALEAAGVAVVFSAGNEGPGSSTITPPKNINVDLVNTFAVGALDANSGSLPIASFSSWGPSVCGGDTSLLIKPEVSAPGVSVRSCVPGGGYGDKSGTSMAAPHVSGALLLLKEAFPDLLGYELKLALYYTCTDLGILGEDNVFGMGIIDVEAAFNYLVAAGHVPVSPVVSHDIQLLDFEVNRVLCEETIIGSVWVENAGTEPVSSFELDLYDGTFLIATQTWTGDLEPNERVWVDLLPATYSMGNYDLALEVRSPNGQTDARPLNNRLVQSVLVDDRTFPGAYLAMNEQMQLCEGGDALLRVDYPGPGKLQVDWFDAYQEGNLLGTGSTLLLEGVQEPTTVYAELTYTQKVGMEERSLGTFELESEASGKGLVFDAKQAFTLKSFVIYAAEGGGLIIQIENEDGTPIAQKVLALQGPGKQRLFPNLFIPQGNNLQIKIITGIPLYYNTGGVDFPYEIEDYVTIKKSNFPFGGTSSLRYYFFYDWDVEYHEICGRSAVEVWPTGSGNIPNVAIQASENEVDLGSQSGAVSFTALSPTATQWFWSFGDGAVSTEANPTHIFDTPGSYTVSLTVSEADGCAAVATTLIEVIDLSLTGSKEITTPAPVILLYPNPSSGRVQLVWQGFGENPTQVQLIDVLGRIVWTKAISRLGSSGQQELDLEQLDHGVYWLILEATDQRLTQKLIVVD